MGSSFIKSFSLSRVYMSFFIPYHKHNLKIMAIRIKADSHGELFPCANARTMFNYTVIQSSVGFPNLHGLITSPIDNGIYHHIVRLAVNLGCNVEVFFSCKMTVACLLFLLVDRYYKFSLQE